MGVFPGFRSRVSAKQEFGGYFQGFGRASARKKLASACKNFPRSEKLMKMGKLILGLKKRKHGARCRTLRETNGKINENLILGFSLFLVQKTNEKYLPINNIQYIFEHANII